MFLFFLGCNFSLSVNKSIGVWEGNRSCNVSNKFCNKDRILREELYCSLRKGKFNCRLFLNATQIMEVCKGNASINIESIFGTGMCITMETCSIWNQNCTKISSSRASTKKVQKLQLALPNRELSAICKMFHVNYLDCKCNDFFVKLPSNETMLLFNVMQLEKRISYDGRKFKIISVPTLINQMCAYVNLTEENCFCNLFLVAYKNRSMMLCEPHRAKRFMLNILQLESICKLFNRSSENCSCESFTFLDGNPMYESVCQMIKVQSIPKVTMHYHGAYSQAYAGIAVTSSVIGMIGNGLVILIAIRYKNTLSTCKMLISHLACCDFMFAILQLVMAVPKFWTNEWLYGVFLCKSLLSSERLGTCLATGLILVVSIERFVGIVNPFHGGLSEIALNLILATNVIFGAATITPLIIYYNVSDNGICMLRWSNGNWDSTRYNLSIIINYFAVPTSIITILYAVIISTLRRTVSFRKNSAIADPRLRLKRVRENRRTVCMLMAVVFAFVLFVLPSNVVNLYMNYLESENKRGKYADIDRHFFFMLHYVANMPYPLHVAINPIIYSLIDDKWRNDVKNAILNVPKRAGSFSTTMSSVQLRSRSNAGPILDGSMDDSRRISPPKLLSIRESDHGELGATMQVTERFRQSNPFTESIDLSTTLLVADQFGN